MASSSTTACASHSLFNLHAPSSSTSACPRTQPPLSRPHSSHGRPRSTSLFFGGALRPYARSPALTVASAKSQASGEKKDEGAEYKQVVVEEEEEEEELPWIQDKAMDLVEFTGSVAQAIPGPRVGRSSLPWILAVPLTYAAVTFVIAFVRTVNKFNSPKEKRRKLVNKNATLCTSIDELFEKGRENVHYSALKDLMNKTGFEMGEIFRKYIRYALNEKPFDLNLVANLIHLRKASMLEDSAVVDIINNISSRVVRDKGPVVMDMSGYSEKGFQRKLAVKALFGKIYYLSELPEFCSRDSSLKVKEVFGVTDEDAEKLRLHTMSEAGDVESLEKLMGESDSQDSESNHFKRAE